MRAPVALLLVLLLASSALAEPSVATEPDLRELRLRRRSARLERGLGLGLAGLSLACIAVGGVLLGVSGPAAYNDGSRYQLIGEVGVAACGVLVIPGVALSIHGQLRLTDVEWRLRLLAGTFVSPARGGMVAGFATTF